MVGLMKDKNGATFIELMMTILVLAIIGATVIGVIVFFVQLFMYSPQQLDTQKLGVELENIMLEGNQNIRGIRYTRNVKGGSGNDPSAIQFCYTYGYPTAADQLTVRFRWNAADKHIYRTTSTDNGQTWSAEVIPYYITSGITIDGKSTPSVIFTYKKAADADWVAGTDPISAIRRVIISISIKSGTGSFAAFAGSSDITASAEIKSF
jgi:type II secretory pathway pseudopilin PulG